MILCWGVLSFKVFPSSKESWSAKVQLPASPVTVCSVILLHGDATLQWFISKQANFKLKLQKILGRSVIGTANMLQFLWSCREAHHEHYKAENVSLVFDFLFLKAVMEPAGNLRQSGNVLADNTIYLNFFCSFILSIHSFALWKDRELVQIKLRSLEDNHVREWCAAVIYLSTIIGRY